MPKTWDTWTRTTESTNRHHIEPYIHFFFRCFLWADVEHRIKDVRCLWPPLLCHCSTHIIHMLCVRVCKSLNSEFARILIFPSLTHIFLCSFFVQFFQVSSCSIWLTTQFAIVAAAGSAVVWTNPFSDAVNLCAFSSFSWTGFAGEAAVCIPSRAFCENAPKTAKPYVRAHLRWKHKLLQEHDAE